MRNNPQIYLDELSLLPWLMEFYLIQALWMVPVSVRVRACVCVNDFLVHGWHICFEAVDPAQPASGLPAAPLPRTLNRTVEISTPCLLNPPTRVMSHWSPSPVIRAHWDWLACSATLDWMIPIYPQPCLPRRSLPRQELPGSSVCLSPDLLEAAVRLVTEPADPWP